MTSSRAVVVGLVLGRAALVGLVLLGSACLDEGAKHRFYGNAYAQRGEHVEALREYEAALRDDPDDAAALSLSGHSLFELGRLGTAEARYLRALVIDPSFGDAHFGLALLLARKGDRRGAIRHFEAVVRGNPRDLTSLTNLGRLYLAEGRLDQARQRLDQALAVSPEDVGALFVRGKVEIEAAAYEDARRIFRKLGRIAPEEAFSDYGLAAIEARRGNRAGALRLLASALDRGMQDRASLRGDASFRSLATDPEFLRLVSDPSGAPAVGSGGGHAGGSSTPPRSVTGE